MPTPSKPYVVLTSEKKSHRTKKELKQRQQGESALATGVALKERSNNKSNSLAHKEFKRINDLLKKIEKNDAIYEPVVNRYCLIQAECAELEQRREYFFGLIEALKDGFEVICDELAPVEKADKLIEFTKEIARLTNGMMSIDKMLQTKRKMLLDIEKENIMTIAAALRSIPKNEEKSSNKLLEALRDG
jgi:predicted nuclease with TOPRIM domain